MTGNPTPETRKPVSASELLRQLRAEGVVPNLGCGYGCHDWRYDLDTNLKTCAGSCGGVYQMDVADRFYVEYLALRDGGDDV